MTFPPAQFAQLKPFPCLDVGGLVIPPFSMLEITNFSVNFVASVKRPSADSLAGIVCMSGPQQIPANGEGIVYIGMGIATYTGGPPVVDEIWGTDEDSYLLTANKAGFKIIGVDTSLGLAAIREIGIADVFFKDFTFLDSADPATIKYNAAATSITVQESGATPDHLVGILELASPMGGIGAIDLMGLLTGSAPNTGGADNAPNHQAELTFALIKTELVGSLAIDQLTHNDLASLTTEGFQFGGGAPHDWTGAGTSLVLDTSDITAPEGLHISPAAAATSGPYFGLRIDITGSTSFGGGPLLTKLVIADTTPDAADPLDRSSAKPAAFYGL